MTKVTSIQGIGTYLVIAKLAELFQEVYLSFGGRHDSEDFVIVVIFFLAWDKGQKGEKEQELG